MPEKQTDVLRFPAIDPSDLANIPELTPERKAFLEGSYLERSYLVAPEAQDALTASFSKLISSVPGFECVVNVEVPQTEVYY